MAPDEPYSEITVDAYPTPDLIDIVRENPDYTLPGRGGVYRESCGSTFVYRNERHPEDLKTRHSFCYRSRCSVCWEEWQKKQAYFTALYVEALTPFVYHVMFSTKNKLESPERLRVLFRRFMDMCRGSGTWGASTIYHPYRHSDPSDKSSPWVTGAHLHCFIDCYIDVRKHVPIWDRRIRDYVQTPIKEWIQAKGWVYKNLSVFPFPTKIIYTQPVGRGSERNNTTPRNHVTASHPPGSLIRRLIYDLGHVGISRTRPANQSVTHMGTFSRRHSPGKLTEVRWRVEDVHGNGYYRVKSEVFATGSRPVSGPGVSITSGRVTSAVVPVHSLRVYPYVPVLAAGTDRRIYLMECDYHYAKKAPITENSVQTVLRPFRGEIANLRKVWKTPTRLSAGL